MSGDAANPYPVLPNLNPPAPAQPLNPAVGPSYAMYGGQPGGQVYGGMPVQAGYPAYPPNPAYPQNQAYPPGSYVPMQGPSGYSPVAQNQAVIYAGQPVNLSPSKGPAYAYIIFTLVIIILCVVDLLLDLWVEYCDASISLTNYEIEGHTASLDSAVSDFCPWTGISFLCGDVCSNFKKLRDAGIAMKGMGIPAIVSLALSVLRMLLLILRPNRIFGAIIIRITLIITTIVWIIATIVYLSSFSSVSSHSPNSSVKIGLVLAVIISAMQLANCALGNIAVSKLRR